MADDKLAGRSTVIAALMGASERDRYVPPPVFPIEEIRALAVRRTSQINAEKQARCVIYAAVSRWAGLPVEPEGRIPIVRDGQIVEWRGTLLADPAQPILRAANLAPVARLKTERTQLKALLDAAEAVRQSMEQLEVEFILTLDRTWRSGERGMGEPVDIVHALGIEQALNVSLHGAMQNIRERLKEIDEELTLQPTGRGRPKIRPAHEVARTFAQLYAQVTGKRPTCSVSDSIVSGEFAPALRDLFDAFGWKSTDIRGPGNSAVAAITDEYLRICGPKNRGLGSLFGLGQ